jgi:hypothetical protein
MLEKLEQIEQRYEELNQLISDPVVIADTNTFKKYMKEQSAMTEIVEKYREYKRTKQAMDDASELMEDPDMKEIAETEYYDCKNYELRQQNQALQHTSLRVIHLVVNTRRCDFCLFFLRGFGHTYKQWRRAFIFNYLYRNNLHTISLLKTLKEAVLCPIKNSILQPQ